MKNKFFIFCEKFIAGGYNFKIGKLPLGMPKIFPIFVIAITISAYGQLTNSLPITYTGFTLIWVGVFGFFYFNLFPKRRPKGPFGI